MQSVIFEDAIHTVCSAVVITAVITTAERTAVVSWPRLQ